MSTATNVGAKFTNREKVWKEIKLKINEMTMVRGVFHKQEQSPVS